MENQDKKIDTILATVVSILHKIDEQLVTKTEFEEFKSGIYSHIDGFVKLHETLDQELVSLRNKYDRLENWIKLVAEKTGTKLPT